MGAGATGLDEKIKEMNKPLTKHQMILWFASRGWSDFEISEAMKMNPSVVNIIRRSPLGASEIERMREENGN